MSNIQEGGPSGEQDLGNDTIWNEEQQEESSADDVAVQAREMERTQAGRPSPGDAAPVGSDAEQGDGPGAGAD